MSPPLFGERVDGDFRGADEYGELPAHTGAVFTGDTLFVSGIGQLWEGNELQFLIGADKLRKLPPLTVCILTLDLDPKAK